MVHKTKKGVLGLASTPFSYIVELFIGHNASIGYIFLNS